MQTRDEILRKMQIIRIHATGARGAERKSLEREFKSLRDELVLVADGQKVGEDQT